MNEKLKKLWDSGFIFTADVIDILDQLDDNELDRILEILKKNNQYLINKEIIYKYIEKKEENKSEKKEIKEIKIKNNSNILSFVKTIEKNKDEKSLEIKKEVIIKIDEGEIHEKKEREILEEENINFNILKNYLPQKNKPDIYSWVSFYKARLNKIKKILKEHSEMKNVYSLNNLPEGEEAGIIGMIYDKRFTEKGLKFIIEDGTGKVSVFVSSDMENYDLIRDIPYDSVIGFYGRYKRGIFYADKVILPDVPFKSERKLGNSDSYILFTGDFQIGSKFFLENVFKKFIDFLNGKYGNEKIKEISRKISDVLIVGDVVDGVGIYPDQEKELIYKSYEKQYEVFDKYLEEISENKRIIIIPGNHDIPRLAEPQPALPDNLFPLTKNLKNIYRLSNPSLIQIDSLKILMYHGYSMDWLVSDISYIRKNGGYENPSIIMQFMLMLRHLAPSHGSTTYIPILNDDPLVIDEEIDILHTGHIHRASYSVYKGIDMVNSSCFQDITTFQKELGHKPQPGIVFLRNIKNGEVLMIDFINDNIIKIF